MIPAQLFLDSSRRLILRLITIGLSALAAIFILIVSAMLVLAPKSGLVIFLVVLVAFFISCCITLATIRTWSLRQAIVPLTLGLFMIISVVGLLIPDLGPVAAPFLAFTVLLVNLSGSRRVTLLSACVSAVIAMTIVSSLPRPFPTLDLGIPVVESVTVLAAGAFVVVIWLVWSRFIESQDTALALAEQRANEAELARAESEAARAAIEQQSVEQTRLLDLVRSLELPVLAVGDGLLVVPMVGDLDRQRMFTIQAALLRKVAEQHAHTVVLDVTGITLIDATVASALFQTAQGIQLLGARTLISGMHAEVARTLAGLGINLTGLQSVGNLGQAIDVAKQREPTGRQA